MRQELEPKDFDNLTDLLRTTQDAFRMATLQLYRTPREDRYMARWQGGDRSAARLCAGLWIKRVVAPAVAEERVLRRVHVVLGPVDPFMTFRMNQYAYAYRAGEDVRVLGLPRAHHWPHGIAPGDWWLLDDVLVTMAYTRDGTLASAVLTDDAEAVGAARAAKAAAMGHSTALQNAWPWSWV